MFGNSGAFSYSPGGFSPEDFPQHRRAAQHDELKPSPLQRNGIFRPSGRVIYMQRKEYSEKLNKPVETFHVRVEHLFTGELDGRDMKTLDDCVAKLKILDSKGRLWPQEMILEVQSGYLLLSDIETKAELEALPLSSIIQTKAVLDSCAYNSLLTVTVQQRSKGQVFMFQCEETGAELVKSDLDKLISNGGSHDDPRRESPDIRKNIENIIRQQSFRSQPERILPPADDPPQQWSSREPDYASIPRSYTPQDDPVMYPERRSSPDMFTAPGSLDDERNAEILNHVIDDLEIFMAKVAAAGKPPVSQEGKSKKKKKKKLKKNAINLPPWEEYAACLQKIKYGFNLLGQLEGSLSSPSAPEYVHIFFTSLEQMVFQYPAEIPPSVVSPLLTDMAVELLDRVVGPEENQLWRSLGECWNVPRSRWPDTNVVPYIPQFYDGWQPPAPTYVPQSYPNSLSGRTNTFPNDGYTVGGMQWQPDEVQRQTPVQNGSWDLPPSEPPLYMRAMYDFVARNNRELSIMTGEEVKVIQKSKQWWLVQNSRGEQGNVPQNVLEPMRSSGPPEDFPRDPRSSVTLNMNSSPAEVKAWLRSRGFSNITVSSLGVLSGNLLLGMNKNEMKTVCPEEGGKVFFQLQAVKSAIALASEPSGMYNSRY